MRLRPMANRRLIFLLNVAQRRVQRFVATRAPKGVTATQAGLLGVLADALFASESDPAARVIVMRGEGDMFTSGNDVGEFAAIAAGAVQGERHVSRFLRALAQSSRPLVAAVQGRAVGIGTTMLLHCDLVVLAENALLSTPFVNLALVPEASSSLLMPLRIGYARAFEMLALGDAVDARSAFAWGLANRVVPLDKLDVEARALAARLARQPARAWAASWRGSSSPKAATWRSATCPKPRWPRPGGCARWKNCRRACA